MYAREYLIHDPKEQNVPSGYPVVCNYIELFDNRHFAIVTDVHPEYDFSYKNYSVSFHVYVDGKYAVNNCTTKEYVWSMAGRRTVLGPGPGGTAETGGQVRPKEEPRQSNIERESSEVFGLVQSPRNPKRPRRKNKKLDYIDLTLD